MSTKKTKLDLLATLRDKAARLSGRWLAKAKKGAHPEGMVASWGQHREWRGVALGMHGAITALLLQEDVDAPE